MERHSNSCGKTGCVHLLYSQIFSGSITDAVAESHQCDNPILTSMAISKNVNSSFPSLTFCLTLKWLPETMKLNNLEQTKTMKWNWEAQCKMNRKLSSFHWML